MKKDQGEKDSTIISSFHDHTTGENAREENIIYCLDKYTINFLYLFQGGPLTIGGTSDGRVYILSVTIVNKNHISLILNKIFTGAYMHVARIRGSNLGTNLFASTA